MMDNISELNQSPELQPGPKFIIEDQRAIKDNGDIFKLGLQTEKIGEKLDQFSHFLGEFKKEDGREIKINLVDGGTGSGQVSNEVLEVSLPSSKDWEEQKKIIAQTVSNNDQKAIDFINRPGALENLMMSSTISTAMHECEHTLINSRPDSVLASKFKDLKTGIENTNGHVVTLLDEGIVYAFQFLQDEKNETIEEGKILEPYKPESKDFLAETRQILGRALKGEMEKYLTEGKAMDNDFLKFAGDEMKKLDLEKYVELSNNTFQKSV